MFFFLIFVSHPLDHSVDVILGTGAVLPYTISGVLHGGERFSRGLFSLPPLPRITHPTSDYRSAPPTDVIAISYSLSSTSEILHLKLSRLN